MILVALVAVISAVAMYLLARYVRHSKTAEAIGSVTAIAEAAATYYESSDGAQPVGTTPDQARAMRHFPPSSNGTVPPSLDMVKGKRYQSSLADWAGPPWIDMRFSIPQPQYYAYSFDAQGSGVAARAAVTAQGDLDGNGKASTYSLGVSVDPGSFKARVDKDIKTHDPDE
jgi:hypothetical protein